MSTPMFAEDSNLITLSPNFSHTIEFLGDDADKYDYLMAFFITIMAESGYRVACLYDQNTNTWSKDMTRIPDTWKPPDKKIYEIDFLWYKRNDIGCKLIGIPVGDWLILNLLPKGASFRCKTRSDSVNVVKHVNMYPNKLGRFWHLKELAIRFKNNLLAPLHGEIMMEIGVASPSLQGLPQEIKFLIADMLDKNSRENLEKTCQDFRSTGQNCVLSC